MHRGKQDKHIPGGNNYIVGRSIVTISDSEKQELINTYAGTGALRFSNSGVFQKEMVDAGRPIGFVIGLDGNVQETNFFDIHYSKNETHIVPTQKRKDDE